MHSGTRGPPPSTSLLFQPSVQPPTSCSLLDANYVEGRLQEVDMTATRALVYTV